MINKWQKNCAISFLLISSYFLFSMEQDEFENQFGCYYRFEVTQKSNGRNAVPLDILLEKKEHQDLVLELANSLKKGQSPDKGLLLCGASGCGKLSLVWDICLIAQCELISVNIDFITERKQDNIKNLFDRLNKNTPLVLYVPHFEELIKNGGEFLDKFMNAFNNFRKFNNSIFLICATTDLQMCKNIDIASIFLLLKIGLPSNELRKKIFMYYCDQTRIGVAYSKEREEKYQDESYNKINFDNLVTVSYGMNGGDIREIVHNAAISIRENIPNSNSGLFLGHVLSNLDFKEISWRDTFYAMAMAPAIVANSFLASNTEGLVMNYLLTFCKIRQQQFSWRK